MGRDWVDWVLYVFQVVSTVGSVAAIWFAVVAPSGMHARRNQVP